MDLCLPVNDCMRLQWHDYSIFAQPKHCHKKHLTSRSWSDTEIELQRYFRTYANQEYWKTVSQPRATNNSSFRGIRCVFSIGLVCCLNPFYWLRFPDGPIKSTVFALDSVSSFLPGLFIFDFCLVDLCFCFIHPSWVERQAWQISTLPSYDQPEATFWRLIALQPIGLD